MICFKDMTFCVADCSTSACWRKRANHGPNPRDLPLSQSDFSHTCPDFHPNAKSKSQVKRIAAEQRRKLSKI